MPAPPPPRQPGRAAVPLPIKSAGGVPWCLGCQLSDDGDVCGGGQSGSERDGSDEEEDEGEEEEDDDADTD